MLDCNGRYMIKEEIRNLRKCTNSSMKTKHKNYLTYLAAKTNISSDEIDLMIDCHRTNYGNKCPISGSEMEWNGAGALRACLDHCRECNRCRGFIKNSINRNLERLRDIFDTEKINN